MSIRIGLALFCIVYFSTSAEALKGEPNLGFRKVVSEQQKEEKPAAPEILTYEGDVHCTDHEKDKEGKDHEKCDLEFTRSDGEKFDLDGNSDLEKAVCEKHDRHLKVKISTTKTPKFLFWGGDLKVTQFEVLGVLPETFCAAFQESEKSRPSSMPRAATRRGRGAI